jgi:hypothetical protein
VGRGAAQVILLDGVAVQIEQAAIRAARVARIIQRLIGMPRPGPVAETTLRASNQLVIANNQRARRACDRPVRKEAPEPVLAQIQRYFLPPYPACGIRG